MFTTTVVAAIALTSNPASVGPMGLVRAADAEVDKILATKAATPEQLAARADAYIDFVELARRALGREWGSLSKAQQEEFAASMKAVLRASYAQKALADGRGGAKVAYGAERVEGNEATVSTTLTNKNEAVPVVYRLFRPSSAGVWRIYDVVTDEVSLVETYADQFRQVIAKRGVDGLLKSLRSKRDQVAAPAKP